MLLMSLKAEEGSPSGVTVSSVAYIGREDSS